MLQTIEFNAPSISDLPVGSLLSVVLLDGSNTLLSNLTEVSKGQYTGTVEDIPTGEYRLNILLDGKLVGYWWVPLVLAVGSYEAVDKSNLPSKQLDLSSIPQYGDLIQYSEGDVNGTAAPQRIIQTKIS